MWLAGQCQQGEDAALDQVWAMLKQEYPFFAGHEAATERTIPVVALTRVH